MNTYSDTEFKANFSEIMDRVQSGEEIIITYGAKQEPTAVLVPYATYKSKSKKVRLGSLQDQKLIIHDDFKMTAEELLGYKD